jgi:putative flippase GtrA
VNSELSWPKLSPGHLRVTKFLIVGAIGIGVQLTVLTILVRAGINYLLATALAVESAVLHNFLWHQKFTWADRRGSGASGVIARLLRFHLSNGAISLMGNLLMMRFFVGLLELPVVIANLLTIASCALINFTAGDRWVFSEAAALPIQAAGERSRMRSNVRCANGT